MGPKKGLALLLEPKDGGDEMSPDSEDEEAPEADFDDAANDAFDAQKNGDKEAFRLALRRAVECCRED